MRSKALFVLSMLPCLLITVIALLVTESLRKDEHTRTTVHDFQHMVHGVGLGATTKPAWCYINFDPRVDPRCSCIEWPIPGGYCYCPDHTGTVSFIAGNMEMGAAIEIIKK
ncbi:MAG: hypothetical protein BROFUL_01392 [Candidatus Brocadia fulgida]|uniref:Uncharacterized protein n=1 Tax=Candidatus Brocadia fulgida TaxID=380242 RepID=A0A0M2UZG0_9BACT|nr:MAG: hypothetical protein BROFUL_01392 [Candidatus Brocadia fulgida]